jgi:hypothetical protein
MTSHQLATEFERTEVANGYESVRNLPHDEERRAITVDAHSHIFPRIRGRIAGGSVIGKRYGRATVGEELVEVLPPLNPRVIHTPLMLLAAMDNVGVDRAVLLQGPFYGYCNSYVGKAITQFQARLAGSIAVDPWTDGKRTFEKAYQLAGGARAFKLEFSERTGLSGIHPSAVLGGAEVAWLWSELEMRHLVLVIDLGHIGGRGYQTEALRAIAVRHPRLQIVIAHLGQPNPGVLNDSLERRLWLDQVALGTLPNVSFDTASLPAYFASEASYRGLEECLRWAIDTVGAEKIMWGSDIPAMLRMATYRQLHNVIGQSLTFLDNAGQRSVFGENALRVFWRASAALA